MHVPSTCPICQKVFDPLRSRALIVTAGRVRAFCSEACRNTAELADEDARAGAVVDAVLADARGSSSRRWLYLGAALALVALATIGLVRGRGAHEALPSTQAAMTQSPPFSVADALKLLQSSAEPTDGGVPVSEIPERDLWLHPLAGPERKMPTRSTRRFGATRNGMRPDECRSGHCGVDLGEAKGEAVFAAHDGVVERIVEEDTGAPGGRYVRLNHRGGTITTSYMHLDTIRAGLRPGVPVRAGDLLGTVGDTGVFHSGPHLHFQIGVRARPGETELFIDPEPLLHLWALRPPLDPKAPRHLARSPRATDVGPKGM